MNAVHGGQAGGAAVADGMRFDLTERQAALQRATADCVRQAVIPHEQLVRSADGVPWELVQSLRAEARRAGVYGPQISPRWGGLGADWRTTAIVFEEAGTSLLGPLALNCSAPDEGNIHLLEKVASPAPQERLL